MSDYKILRTIPSRNPHNKPLSVVEMTYGENGEYKDIEILCVACEVPLDLMGEPHYSKILYTEEAKKALEEKLGECPWEGPKIDENGEYAPVDYPDDHPYFAWWENYNAECEKAFSCLGPPYSKYCETWIGSASGPLLHSLCDEECYCDCHIAECICPKDLDIAVRSDALAIVCSIHGHVYSKVTTQDL